MAATQRKPRGRKPGKFTRLVDGYQVAMPGYVRLAFFLEQDVADGLYILARKQGRSPSDVINKIARSYLKKNKTL